MKSKNVKNYFFNLIREAHKWQYTNTNGIGKKPKFYFSNVQVVLIIIAIVFSSRIMKFNNDFTGYIMATLSVFVGLFTNLIITMFDKFSNIDYKTEQLSKEEKYQLVKQKNFFIQFITLTTYSIIISLICIILVSFSLISEFCDKNLLEFEFIFNYEEALKVKPILLFLENSIIFIYRIITIYFLLDFILILIYAISNLYNYISVEVNKKKILNE